MPTALRGRATETATWGKSRWTLLLLNGGILRFPCTHPLGAPDQLGERANKGEVKRGVHPQYSLEYEGRGFAVLLPLALLKGEYCVVPLSCRNKRPVNI